MNRRHHTAKQISPLLSVGRDDSIGITTQSARHTARHTENPKIKIKGSPMKNPVKAQFFRATPSPTRVSKDYLSVTYTRSLRRTIALDPAAQSDN